MTLEDRVTRLEKLVAALCVHATGHNDPETRRVYSAAIDTLHLIRGEILSVVRDAGLEAAKRSAITVADAVNEAIAKVTP